MVNEIKSFKVKPLGGNKTNGKKQKEEKEHCIENAEPLVQPSEPCSVVKELKSDMDYEYEYDVPSPKQTMPAKISEGVSICIAAYKADKYIKETLDSVNAQTWFKTNDNWECIVGVDGCRQTHDYI